MIIMGIDPGLAIVGFGVVKLEGHKIRPLSYGTIQTEAKTPIPLRLGQIYREMNNLIEEYRPDEVAFEELFFNRNTTTAITVAQARGVEILACHEGGIPIYEYTPLQVKQAVVGYGRAEKHQVQEMVRMLLCLDAIPRPDDAADGLAIALTHAHSQGHKSLFLME
ncbi:MAG: crossover junction endodeoxyribonuclease RuvC [Tissierellia bacterium]|nr:crossover junction endodeoxyribonuclease RuvC [Tissierellia bacterium]